MSTGSQMSEISIQSLVDSAWGTPDFDGCNFCRRGRQADGVKMISDRHHECLMCRAYMRKHCPQNCTGPAKTKYQKSLAEDDDLHEMHTAGAVQLEGSKPTKPAAPLRKGTVKRKRCGDTVIEDERPEQKLLKTQGRKMEIRECIGVLWPVDEFEKVERKTTQADLSTIKVNNVLHTGVLRPRSKGVPDGGKEIFSTDDMQVHSVAQLHNSTEAVAEGETESITKFAMDKMKVQTATQNEADEKSGLLKFRGEGKKKKASDIDALDSIWEGPTIVASKEAASEGKEKQGEGEHADEAEPSAKKPSTRKRKADDQAPTQSPAKQRKAELSTGEAQLVATPPGKRAKEIAATEQVLLQCQQQIRDALNPETLRNMSDIIIKQVLTKARARVSTNLVKIYAETGDDSPSMQMFTNLKEATQKLDKLQIISAVVYVAKGKEPCNGRALLEAKVEYTDHINSIFDCPTIRRSCCLPVAYLELAIERDLDVFIAAQNWEGWVSLLEKEWTGLDETPVEMRPYLGLLPATEQAPFKDKMMINALANTIRVDHNKDQVRSLASTLRKMTTLEMEGTDESWLSEWRDFVKVLWPMASDVGDEDLVAAKERLATNKQLRLWRPLALHDTGSEIMAEASAAVQQRIQDGRYLTQLTSLHTTVMSLSGLKDKTIISADGHLSVPERQTRKTAYESLQVIRRKSSAEFQQRHRDKLTEICGKMDEATDHILEQFNSWNKKKFNEILTKIVAWAKGIQEAQEATNAEGAAEQNKAQKEKAQKDIQELMSMMTDLLQRTPKMGDLHFIEDKKLEEDAQDARSNALRTLLSALTSLEKSSVKAEDPQTIALHQMLEQPHKWLSDLQMFSKFKESFVDFIFAAVSESIAGGIPAEKMKMFWDKVKDCVRADSGHSQMVTDISKLDLPELDEVSSVSVLHATTTASDNYAAWHTRLVRYGDGTGDAIQLGALCAIPVIGEIVKQARALQSSLNKDITAEVLYGTDGNTQGEILHVMRALRKELDSNPRKGENVSTCFQTIRVGVLAYLNTTVEEVARGFGNDLKSVVDTFVPAIEDEGIVEFLKVTATAWPEASTPRLVGLAGSDAARSIYRCNKYLETYEDGAASFVKTYSGRVSDEALQLIKNMDFKPEKVRTVSGLLTAVQAMARPLRVGESRSQLLSKCKTVLTAKGMWQLLPPHVQDRIVKSTSTAAVAKPGQAATSTGPGSLPGSSGRKEASSC